MKSRKSLAALLCVAMILALAAGCGNTDNNAANTQQPNSQQPSQPSVGESNNQAVVSSDNIDNDVQRELITIGGTDPGSLDPFDSQDATHVFLWSVYEPLFEVEGKDLVPVLADVSRGKFGGYDHEDGSNKYTVYIYDNIVDSQGNHITASDVVFSTQARMDSGLATNADAWDHAEVVDNTTVDFYFQREMNLVGDLIEYWARTVIFSEAAYKASASGLKGETVGTGRYEVTDYTQGVSMTLEKRDSYWQTDESKITQRHMANVNTIVYQFISEEAQKVIALETGAVDLVESLSTTSLTDFRDGGSYGDQYDIYSYPDNLTSYVAANMHPESIMSDINMRLAVFYAIDADGVVAGLGSGAATRAHTVGNYKYPGYNTAWDTQEDFESVTSQELVDQYLKAAGYQGQTIKILTPDMIANGMIIEIIQQILLNAGIDCSIEVMDFPTFLATTEDPSTWDLQLQYMAGNSYLVSVWKNVFMTNAELFGVADDTEMLDMLANVLTTEGHTQENIDAFRNYIVDQAYAMGLCVAFTNIVYSTDIRTFAMNDMNSVIPGGCTYYN